MAKMAFNVTGTGVPFIGQYGISAAELVLGIKTSHLRLFRILMCRGTSTLANIQSSKPYEIKDKKILSKLVSPRIDLEIKGNQAFYGDLSVGIKIYNENGSVDYDETRLVATRGPSIGGWSISAQRISMYTPSSRGFSIWETVLGFK